MIAILLVVAIFAGLVLVHEWGHFRAARRGGVEVEEFGFGFPPRLFGWKRGGTLYSLNLLPLGGFVRLKGEHSADRQPGSFAAASKVVKTKILLAGVGMNLLVAYLILTVLAAVGLPPLIAGQFNVGHSHYSQPPQVLVAAVAAGSPAAQAGIMMGDFVISANGQNFNTADDLFNFTKANAGQTVTLAVKEGGQIVAKTVTLRPADAKDGFLGVTPLATSRLAYGWWAPVEAAGLAAQLVWGTLAAFGGLIAGLVAHARVSNQVTGPVGIVVILRNLLHLGAGYVAAFVASISLSLAVINALPIPALDGGRLALLVVQKISGRRLPQRTETLIHAVGFAVLIGLMILITVIDVRRLGR